MRSLLPFAALALLVAPMSTIHAAQRNWVDRYIAANGHCTQQPMVLTTAPLDKPIEEWTDSDLADLKAALDHCDALPDAQTAVSRMWTGKFYDVVADLVHDHQRYAAQQEEANQAIRDRAEQAEATRQRRIAADRLAAAARLAALQRAAEQEAAERKVVEERTAATAEELKAAAKLADETEAKAKAARAEAQARNGVEAAKQRAAQAEAQARDADAQARAERAAADKRFTDAHPEASAQSPKPQASSGQTAEPTRADPTQAEALPLRLLGHGCRQEYDYQVCEGEVRNTSGEPLENVMVEVRFQDKAGGFIKSEDAMIGYQPLMPGQTSPFKLGTINNPLIRHYTIAFKQMFGGELKAAR